MALSRLKTAFTTAPILRYPDPSQPFAVKASASERDVGAIQFQRFGENPKLHPVAYITKKLTPAEQN